MKKVVYSGHKTENPSFSVISGLTWNHRLVTLHESSETEAT